MTLDPDPIDKHVGKRMLLRRREIAFSQTKVANALGVVSYVIAGSAAWVYIRRNVAGEGAP